MPTIMTHAVVAAATTDAFGAKPVAKRTWPLMVAVSVLPDADVIAFRLGIPYEHFFGHRGFFHSPCFALLVAVGIVWLFYRGCRPLSPAWWRHVALYFAVGASHGILDAFTDGGEGIALLSPFSDARIFFPWQPIAASPIGLRAFLSGDGLQALTSEMLWIWLPCAILVGSARRLARRKGARVP